MITKINIFKENFGYSIPHIQPKTKKELQNIINKTIKNSPKGYEVDLNFIDTSLIEDMSFLFYDIDNFNGDISQWDVSNVTNMESMFERSEFNGDISKWNVSNVTNMDFMFYDSKFNGDISKWNTSNVTYMRYMFRESAFNQDISNWNVSNVKDMEDIFKGSPLESNPPSWYKQ